MARSALFTFTIHSDDDTFLFETEDRQVIDHVIYDIMRDDKIFWDSLLSMVHKVCSLVDYNRTKLQDYIDKHDIVIMSIRISYSGVENTIVITKEDMESDTNDIIDITNTFFSNTIDNFIKFYNHDGKEE